MTAHPTDAEIAEIETNTALVRYDTGTATISLRALCAAARDRNRLEYDLSLEAANHEYTKGRLVSEQAGRVKLRDTLQQIGFVCSDNAADSCDHRAALRFVAHLIDRTFSQLETDNG